MKRTTEQMDKVIAAYDAREELTRTDTKMARMAEESLAFCDGLVYLLIQKGLVTGEEMNSLPSISQTVRNLVARRSELREVVRAAQEV